MWPYSQRMTLSRGNLNFYGMIPNYEKLVEVATSPVLSRKLYCFIVGWPFLRALECQLGSHERFKTGIEQQPLNMLKDNIPFSVLNAVIAFMALVFGVFGELFLFSIFTDRGL